MTGKVVDSDKHDKQLKTGSKQTREFDALEGKTSAGSPQKDIASLIPEATKVEQLRPKVTVEMKPVKKLIGLKRTYNMHTDVNELIYTFDTRPGKTIEHISETLKARRHKEYVPQDTEVPEYDRERFNKQMMLERIEIKVNEKSYRQEGTIKPDKYRSVLRKRDDAGYFYSLEADFAKWALEFSVDIDEVRALFLKYGQKEMVRPKLIELYSNKWTGLEDITLKKGERNSKQHKHLVKTKTPEEMEKRKKFLKV